MEFESELYHRILRPDLVVITIKMENTKSLKFKKATKHFIRKMQQVLNEIVLNPYIQHIST